MTLPRKILVVDDDAEIVRGTVLRLRVAGYETAAAYDGAEALEQLESNRPDVMLLDVRMPGVDGLTVLNRMEQQGDAKTHVIMLSASLRDQGTALRAGARFFLAKPYRGDDLLQAVQRVLAEPSPRAASDALSIKRSASGNACRC